MKKTVALISMVIAGSAAAASVFAVPTGQMEMWLASAGVSELIPAAAPPLGLKARLILSGGAAVIAMAGIALLLPVNSMKQKDNQKMGLGSKIARFARGRAVAEAEITPVVRRADAHPDAPVREPIFASRDLGADAFENVAPQAMLGIAPEPVNETVGMPRSPDPLPAEELQKEVARMEEASPRLVRPLPLPTRPAHSEDLRGLSLSELTQRLEEGLTRRGLATATAPVAAAEMTPPSSVTALRQAATAPAEMESDAALQAALAALRTITAKAG